MENFIASIIVPVYNMQDYLEKCINSILCQTFRDFEMILVDDGSTDSSPDICDRYASADSRIKVIHKPNGGLSSARNAGLDIATGKYIYFVDSDDYIEPDLLEKALSVMEKEQCDWVGFGMFKEDLNENILERIAFKEQKLFVNTEEERLQFLLKYLLNYKLGWEAWNHVYRGDIIRQNNLRFTSERVIFAEDCLFAFTYWLYAKSCVIFEDFLYHYIQRSDSLLGQSRSKNIIPHTHEFSKAARQAVQTAGHNFIGQAFPILYLHFMEWQARPYIAGQGPEWVRQEISKLPLDEFLPKDAEVFQELIKTYGTWNGYITTVISLASAQDIPAFYAIMKELTHQSYQKLDILVICPSDVSIPVTDPRIRFVHEENLSATNVLRIAFENAWGEYLFFAGNADSLPVHYLMILSDGLKYNECGTVMQVTGESKFFSKYIHEDRLALRFRLRKERTPHIMFRTTLLAESGLADMEPLSEYTAEIVLSDHALLIHEE